MYKSFSTILIWSGNYKKLADWYEKVLGLKVTWKSDHPEDTGVLFGFEGKETDLWIGQHDRVIGKNRDFYRIMINIKVDSVSKVYKELLNKGIKFEAKPFKAPTLPYWFATFYDPENNLLQLIGGK